MRRLVLGRHWVGRRRRHIVTGRHGVCWRLVAGRVRWRRALWVVGRIVVAGCWAGRQREAGDGSAGPGACPRGFAVGRRRRHHGKAGSWWQRAWHLSLGGRLAVVCRGRAHARVCRHDARRLGIWEAAARRVQGPQHLLVGGDNLPLHVQLLQLLQVVRGDAVQLIRLLLLLLLLPLLHQLLLLQQKHLLLLLLLEMLLLEVLLLLLLLLLVLEQKRGGLGPDRSCSRQRHLLCSAGRLASPLCTRWRWHAWQRLARALPGSRSLPRRFR